MNENFEETPQSSRNPAEHDLDNPEALQFEPNALVEEPGRHNIRVKDHEGKSLGSTELYYKETPVPHFKVSELYILPGDDTRGHGYGSQLLSFIEENLQALGKPGLLQDVASTNETNHEAVAGMYERHGWLPVPGRERVFAYNLPEGTEPDVFSIH